MSRENEKGADILSLDEQVGELRKSLEELTKSRKAAPEASADPLIERVAKNLAEIRQARGLPAKEADEFEAEIRKRAERVLEAKEPTSETEQPTALASES